MDWIQFLSKEITLANDRKLGFHEPAPQSLLAALKKQFNLTQLPPELEELYLQTNGIDDFLYIKQSDESIKMGHFIWPVERVIETTYLKELLQPIKEYIKASITCSFLQMQAMATCLVLKP